MAEESKSSGVNSSEILVKHSRDALIFLNLIHNKPLRAELRGLITKVRHHGGLIFFDFEDATSSIQLIAHQERFNDPDWSCMLRIKSSDRVIAEGSISHSNTGEPSIVLEKILQLIDQPETTNKIRTVRELDRVGVRLFLARLRYKAEDFFRSNGFLQIEPNFISTTWVTQGIEPLRVQYEGFGVPTYLTPSPSPQLIAAMETTGLDKVFAVGRCFTTTYRDETTSAESLILMAKLARTTISEITEISKQALSATLGDNETMPENYQNIMRNGWNIESSEISPELGINSLVNPTIQIYNLPLEDTNRSISGTTITTIMRACWPPKMVLIEGSLRILNGSSGVGTITLFLERSVPLLKDVPLRQLKNLQREGN
jgi:hypothetical protein